MDTLTTLFVVPTGNTLPTINTNAQLTGTQFGIFLPNQAPATVANAGSAAYLFMSQNRNVASYNEGTKNSDFIYAKNILYWYKVTGSLAVNRQITTISALNAGCQEDISVTLRLDSYYIRMNYFNGLTRSVMVTTPCCACGSNPCTTLQPSDIAATMVSLATEINADPILSKYVVATNGGSGATTTVIISALPLANYAINSCDLTNFPYQHDKLFFKTFVRSGPDLTTDYEVTDICNVVATVTLTQAATFIQNTPDEVKQMEKNYFSYQADLGAIFSNPNYNGEFQSYVDSASAYDLYYLVFAEPINTSMEVGVGTDRETVIIAIPNGDSSETPIVNILTAAFGTPVDSSSTL